MADESNRRILTMDRGALTLLQTEAAEKQASDKEDFCTVDIGNYDDCYEAGVRDGRIEAIREVLDLLGVKY